MHTENNSCKVTTQKNNTTSSMTNKQQANGQQNITLQAAAPPCSPSAPYLALHGLDWHCQASPTCQRSSSHPDWACGTSSWPPSSPPAQTCSLWTASAPPLHSLEWCLFGSKHQVTSFRRWIWSWAAHFLLLIAVWLAYLDCIHTIFRVKLRD